MNFLVRYFERSVKASGNQESIARMDAIISKWESRLVVSLKEGVASATAESVSDTVYVYVNTKKVLGMNVPVTEEDVSVQEAAKDFLKELSAEIAMNSKKAKHGNKKAIQNRKELMQFRTQLQGKTDFEIVQMFQEQIQGKTVLQFN